MNFILRFTIWTILWGFVGSVFGAAWGEKGVISGGSQNGPLVMAIMVATGAMIGALGAITQELSSTLRERK
jgi:hypothetical protein